MEAEIPNQLQSGSLLSMLYRTLAECPLHAFVDASCGGDLHCLVKPSHKQPVPESLLTDTWEELTNLYCEQMGDDENRLAINIFKEITKLDISIKQVHFLVDTLRKFHTDEFAKELNKILVTRFKFDTRFPEDYDRDLGRAIKRTKEFEIKMEAKTDHFEVIMENLNKKKKGEKVSLEYYQNILISLSDYSGYPVTDRMSVYEFISTDQKSEQGSSIL
jgi:hypothetical protein